MQCQVRRRSLSRQRTILLNLLLLSILLLSGTRARAGTGPPGQDLAPSVRRLTVANPRASIASWTEADAESFVIEYGGTEEEPLAQVPRGSRFWLRGDYEGVFFNTLCNRVQSLRETWIQI